MFVYDTRKAYLFVNLDHADKLAILPDGFGRWIVAAYLAGSTERTVLSEYSSYKEAETALCRIAAAVKAGRAIYDPNEADQQGTVEELSKSRESRDTQMLRNVETPDEKC